MAIHLNTKKFPTNELAVRRAVAYAINQDVITKTLYKGMYEPTRDLMDPTTFGYEPSVKNVYSYDPAKAREVLEAAGWKPGPDGIRVKDGKRLELVFIMNFQFDAYTYGPLVQAQLRDVGNLELRKEAMTNFMPLIRKGVHNAGDLASAYPDPQVLRPAADGQFGPTQFAYGHYENPEVDKLLEEGMSELDPAKRAEIYRKVQRIVMNDAVSVPIRRMQGVFAVSTRVKDLGFTAVGFPLFYDVMLQK